MIKQNKTISLDMEVIESLNKIDNASKLINDLLREYFSEGSGLKKNEISDRIRSNKEMMLKMKEDNKELQKNIDRIERKEQHIREVYKNVPDEVLDDFKLFPKMTDKVLLLRHTNIYKKKYNVSYEELLKAFNTYFEDRVEEEDVKNSGD